MSKFDGTVITSQFHVVKQTAWAVPHSSIQTSCDRGENSINPTAFFLNSQLPVLSKAHPLCYPI